MNLIGRLPGAIRAQVISTVLLVPACLGSERAGESISVPADRAPPACRLDDSLAPFVETALKWGADDLRADGKSPPFKTFVINPRSLPAAKDVLLVYIVKDATPLLTDSNDCIKRYFRGVQVGDGPCTSTDQKGCTDKDTLYMQARLQEIHSSWSDTQTGYELAGACYVTNLHACLEDDRDILLREVGPRDDISVKGGCVADAGDRPTIRCSAGALKMMLSQEAVSAQAPTLGLLFLLAHELGHLVEGDSSSFTGGENMIDRTSPVNIKRGTLIQSCNTGSTLRGQEEKADAIALNVARHRVKEIAQKWPRQGTVAWIISQAGHFSGNLARWNNRWAGAPTAEIPAVFKQNKGRGVLTLDSADLDKMDSDPRASGRTLKEVDQDALGFLSELRRHASGNWILVMQSGTTHGSLPGRLVFVLEGLHAMDDDSKDPISRMEQMISDLQFKVLRREFNYLRELETSICLAASEDKNWE